MPRVTENERERFHKIVDLAIDKMNLPKNEKKAHWRCLESKELSMMLETETKELIHAVNYPAHGNIFSECCDVINFSLMIADKERFQPCAIGFFEIENNIKE